MILWALLMAGCAVPLGQDYVLTRDGGGTAYITDYNLLDYVPVPKPGERPIILADRADLSMSVVWKDSTGVGVPLPFDTFAAGTVYQAEIRVTPKSGYVFYSTPFVYPAGKISAQIDDLGDSARTVMVTYNNSDDWDITFITDYNLQNYVPIPLAGERPVRTVETRADVRVQATWYEEISANDMPPDPYPFDLGVRYRANIRLTAKPGWRFIEGRDFTYSDGLTITPHETSPEVRRFEVTYRPAISPTVVSDLNLTPYIARPIAGGTPVLSFTGSQYSGIVNWKNIDTQEVLIGPFQAGTAYIAEIVLSPGSGYTFTGLGADAFIHTGAADVNSPAGGGFVTLTFPPAAGVGGLTVVYDTILTGLLPKPVSNATPVTAITSPQYSGAVAWTPAHSTFHINTNYTAVLTLKAAPGYTFTGIGQNAFTHGDASGAVTNPAGSGTVTIAFSTARPFSYQVMSFGPPAATTSALALLKERSAASSQVFVELLAGSETVNYSVTLMPYNTSPANVVIDGRGRILTKISPGSFITVMAGVTLTLQNITLQGYTNNDAPLITVQTGGTLILGNGAVLTGNDTSSDVGGIWVNGGALIMYNGSAIKKMAAPRAGGVLIENGGSFLLSGGTIGGTDPNDGNRAASSGGGGVLVSNGFFDMYDGTIQSNTAEAQDSGGGVAVTSLSGNFTHHGGTITKNIAQEPNSGGGVYTHEAHLTIKGTAVIADNTSEADFSSGGVYRDYGGFIIEGGTIRGNTSKGVSSSGGVYSMGHFEMFDGRIMENIAEGASSGGGVYSDQANFSGGTITKNIAREPDSGGGICVNGGIEITGASITDNRAEKANSGGGIYAGDVMQISLRSGTIQGNTALGPASAGGVYISSQASVECGSGGWSGMIIKGNTSSWNGPGGESAGAVYIAGWDGNREGRFYIETGTIGGLLPQDANTAVKGANGVYVAGEFSLTGGEIKGNTGPNNNYGVYVANTVNVEAFYLYDDAAVDASNLVFLADGAYINISSLNSGNRTRANITCAAPRSYTDDGASATKLLYASSGGSGSDVASFMNSVKDYFLFNGTGIHIETVTTNVSLYNSYCYGYYEP
jgi:hypothetical protein